MTDDISRLPIRDRLAGLIAELSADGELSDDDLRAIHNAAVGQALVIKDQRTILERAHVHEKPHVSVVTLDKAALKAYLKNPDLDAKGQPVTPEERVAEIVDASGLVCHDCNRGLVSDKGAARILICPSLHGRRPPELEPKHPDSAVECGVKAS